MKADNGSHFHRWHARRFGKVVGQLMGKGARRRTAIERAVQRSAKLSKSAKKRTE